MADIILELENLSKTFRSHWTFRPVAAVRSVSLSVQRGEAFGFLGHNGAGKTTTMKMITGLLSVTAGRILLNGQELLSPTQHKNIGYLPELPYFYDHLTVEETLDFFARLHDMRRPERRARIDEILALVKLDDRRQSTVRSLSKGLQQRLGLAQAILNQPELLLLDEPFSGLDPMGRVDVRELIMSLKAQGVTIFLSSHVLSDVEDICDRVSIMSRGELKQVFQLSDVPTLFGQAYEVSLRNPSGTILVHRYNEYETAIQALQVALSGGATLHDFKRCSPNLEEIFMSVTAEAQREPAIIAEVRV